MDRGHPAHVFARRPTAAGHRGRPRTPATRPIRPLVSALGVVALALLALALVRATGGLPNVWVNALYAIVAIAAYEFGWRGGLAEAALLALLFGPVAAFLGTRVDGVEAWAIRILAFALIGTLVGLLFDRMRARTGELEATLRRVTAREREGMLALARGAEAKDTDTGDHVRRVGLSAEALARAAGLDATAAARIGYAGMLHDVGKLHVPDRILLKPGPLTAAEWDVMRRHTIWGEQILADGEGFALARRIARWHQENVDGSGYPDGLAGAAIPLEARIVRVADAFDAMTNRRPYRAPRTVEDALEELWRCRGSQFDPELVELLIRLVRSDAGFARRLEALRAARVA